MSDATLMSLDTTVPVSKSLGDVHGLLVQMGATHIGTSYEGGAYLLRLMYDFDRWEDQG